MNREILFRGKRKDNGEWVEGFISGLCAYSTDDSTGQVNRVDSYYMQNCVVAAETVGQYTGLDDKNGKKIFEGDYCLLTKPCVMAWGIIKYEKSCYWFVENKARTDGTHNMIRLCDLDSNRYEIQVKGNIYDNADLLEEVTQ